MSDTLWHRIIRGTRRIRQRPDWSQFAGPDWADAILQVAVTDDFHAKQGKSTGRWILHSQGRRLAVYLKRHYRLPWWNGLLATLWPDGGWSPALQEWHNLEWARSCGWPVPAPVMVGEFIGPWGRLQDCLAVEELTGMIGLHQAIPLAAARLDPTAFAHWKRGLAVAVAQLTRELHNQRYFHKDLYLCHFYIPATDTEHVQDWTGRLHLIDLHRFRRHRWTWPHWLAKDLGQLLYSSEITGVSARDRLRFWSAYLGYGQGRGPAWLRWVIAIKWRLYRRHNRKRQRRAAPKQAAA
jgi:heptose I phosphotransferase